MSSLFKHPFQTKQAKEFTDLAIKTLPIINRDSAKYIFKSIKNGTNLSWNTPESAISALENKLKLYLQIISYKKIINDKQTNTLREVQSAKQHLTKLTLSTETTQLIHEIERGFNLEKGSLSPNEIKNTHLNPKKSAKKRSRSVTFKSPKIPLQKIENHKRSSTPTINTKSVKFTDKRRSKSVMALNKVSPKIKATLPSMNTKEYLQFLLERAVTNKVWNDNDADRLCQCAISMKCDWITVNSMWVKQCHKSLQKYTLKQYKANLKLHKKSKRRGSKISFKMDKLKDEKHIKSSTKICVTIGYPLGQTSTVSKVAETKQSVQDGAARIRLMISAGKVVITDWDYIINEVKCVVAAAKGADVRIVFPDTSQITGDIKHTFNQKIMQGMAQKTPCTDANQNQIEGGKSKQKLCKLPCTFTDEETSDDGDENELNPPQSSKKKVDLADEAKIEENVIQNEEEKIKHLSSFVGAKRKTNRRASTMTSLKSKRKLSKNLGLIGQSVTDVSETGIEPGAVASKKSKKKRKRKRKNLAVFDGGSNIEIKQLKYKKKRKKKKEKEKEKDGAKKKKKIKKSEKKDTEKKLNKKKTKKKKKQQRAKSMGVIK